MCLTGPEEIKGKTTMDQEERSSRTRCQRMARAPGADWEVLPDVPTARRHTELGPDDITASTWPALEYALRALCEQQVTALQRAMRTS